MQPKLKSKVRSGEREVGEVTSVIVDPLSHDISHIVVGRNGTGERQIPMSQVQVVSDDLIQLKAAADLDQFPPLKRDDFVTTHVVEIAHLEDRLHVLCVEVLVTMENYTKTLRHATL